MKKIIHVIHDLSSGGAETLVKDYALMINKEKFDIKIICFHRRGFPYEKILEENNIDVVYLSDYIKIDRTKSSIHNAIFTIKMFCIFKQIVKKEEPDVLHTHLPINTLIEFANPSKNIKIFHTVHNEPSSLWRKNSFARRLDFRSAKRLVKRNNMRFIVLHEKMRNEVNNIFNVDNSIILNNGINFQRFDNAIIKNKLDFKKELCIPEDAFIVGHIGRFTDQKNHEKLISIFNEISKNNSHAFLLMIGTGELQKTIENNLSNYGLNGKYIILSDRSDIPDLLNIMDCFVFPSKYEGLPVTLIEAQKMNRPCFISDRISDYAIISNLVTVISIEQDDKLWADTILQYKKPNKIELNSEEWNMKNVICKLENIYLGKNIISK